MNTQSKHTPGPWAVCNWMVGNNVPTGETTVCGPNGDEHICTMDGNENNQANAHLIAAAPAMYLELKEGLVLLEASHHDMVDMYGVDSLQAKTVWERIESTRNALAQAKGGE